MRSCLEIGHTASESSLKTWKLDPQGLSYEQTVGVYHILSVSGRKGKFSIIYILQLYSSGPTTENYSMTAAA